MKETREQLKKLGLPGGEAFDLPTSKLEFDGGGNFAIEIASINNLEIMKKTLELLDKYKITCDQFVECRGIFRLPDEEIKKMAALCKKNNIGLVLSVGPRATYDAGGFVKSVNGVRIGYRIRGMEQIVYAVEDVKRAVALGIRGIMVYDEGLLWILKELREKSILPKDMVLKFSVHCGYANPASVKFIENSGANIVNPVPDLDLPMVAAIRKAAQCPISIFTDTAGEAGNFVRTYDVPEFVRIASPIFLKCGSSSQVKQAHLPSVQELEERIKQVYQVIYMLKKYYPSAKRIKSRAKIKAIPV